MIKQYEEGYRHNPESIDEIKALEGLSADAFAMACLNYVLPMWTVLRLLENPS